MQVMIRIGTIEAEPVRQAIILDALRQFLTDLEYDWDSRDEQNDARRSDAVG